MLHDNTRVWHEARGTDPEETAIHIYLPAIFPSFFLYHGHPAAVLLMIGGTLARRARAGHLFGPVPL